MAAASAIDQLRDDTGYTATTLIDADAQALLDEAAAAYTDADSAYAYARLITLRRLLASSAKLHSYTANNSKEEASDVFKHLRQLLAYWQKQLAAAVAVDSARPAAARFGKTGRKPARIKEHPRSWQW